MTSYSVFSEYRVVHRMCIVIIKVFVVGTDILKITFPNNFCLIPVP